VKDRYTAAYVARFNLIKLRESVAEFLAVWNKRSKYHFTDRELVGAVRKLSATSNLCQ
jgi:hypothetical protein